MLENFFLHSNPCPLPPHEIPFHLCLANLLGVWPTLNFLPYPRAWFGTLLKCVCACMHSWAPVNLLVIDVHHGMPSMSSSAAVFGVKFEWIHIRCLLMCCCWHCSQMVGCPDSKTHRTSGRMQHSRVQTKLEACIIGHILRQKPINLNFMMAQKNLELNGVWISKNTRIIITSTSKTGLKLPSTKVLDVLQSYRVAQTFAVLHISWVVPWNRPTFTAVGNF